MPKNGVDSICVLNSQAICAQTIVLALQLWLPTIHRALAGMQSPKEKSQSKIMIRTKVVCIRWGLSHTNNNHLDTHIFGCNLDDGGADLFSIEGEFGSAAILLRNVIPKKLIFFLGSRSSARCTPRSYYGAGDCMVWVEIADTSTRSLSFSQWTDDEVIGGWNVCVYWIERARHKSYLRWTNWYLQKPSSQQFECVRRQILTYYTKITRSSRYKVVHCSFVFLLVRAWRRENQVIFTTDFLTCFVQDSNALTK